MHLRGWGWPAAKKATYSTTLWIFVIGQPPPYNAVMKNAPFTIKFHGPILIQLIRQWAIVQNGLEDLGKFEEWVICPDVALHITNEQLYLDV